MRRIAAVIAVALCGCGRVADHSQQGGGRTDASVDAPNKQGGGRTDASVDAPNTFTDIVVGKSVEKIDLLLMLQNSRSMADKQAVLKLAVPDLVRRVVSPPCLAPNGTPDWENTPDDPRGLCASGETREFTPMQSVHVGVITSSLSCAGTDGAGLEREEADDNGHLIGTRPRFLAAMKATSGTQAPDPAGFLDFDSDVNDGVAALETTVQTMTTSAGEFGCSDESQLESAYRFLVDPVPQNQAGDIDGALLAQRRAFLRPDSLVAVVLVGDRNDRSMRADGTELYPTERYVNVFSQPELCVSRPDLDSSSDTCPDLDGDGRPDIVPNLLFQDRQAQSGLPRDPSLVHVIGIIGVPWQDLRAEQAGDGTPYPPNELHYESAHRLSEPTDALMVESATPRTGLDGENPPRPLASPSAGFLANPVNGHERGNTAGSDLQYACIFPLPAPRDCAAIARMPAPQPSCDCTTVVPGDDNPLCQDSTGAFTTKQGFAKAYPALRQLTVLRKLGDDSAAVASVCARNLVDSAKQDFGYRPALDTIADRLKFARSGKCFPTGKTIGPCTVTEARPRPNLKCDPNRGRLELLPEDAASVRAQLKAQGICDVQGASACSSYSLCRLEESDATCHTRTIPTATTPPGWCIVDPSNDPDDNPSLVAKCPENERRVLRFVDPQNRTPDDGAPVVISCSTGE